MIDDGGHAPCLRTVVPGPRLAAVTHEGRGKPRPRPG